MEAVFAKIEVQSQHFPQETEKKQCTNLFNQNLHGLQDLPKSANILFWLAPRMMGLKLAYPSQTLFLEPTVQLPYSARPAAQ
jgi:hypothetical protein